MKLVLVDPSLEARSSHHYVYNAALAREAVGRGWSVQVIANKRFPFDTLDGIPVLRHFTTNGYPEISNDPVRGLYDAFKQGNDALFDELITLPQSLFPGGALVLCPTATEHQLYGFVRWAEVFPAPSAPQFIAWLMLPPGVTSAGHSTGGLEVYDTARALFYRLATDHAKTLGGRVTLFGSGRTHASDYAALARAPIEAHPVLMSVEPALSPATGVEKQQILLYAGDAKLDKGLGHVPELAATLRNRHPDCPVVIHANFTTAWGVVTEHRKTIDRLPLDDDQIIVKGGMIGPSEYTQLYSDSLLGVLSYDPAEYKHKSSGVLWESIAMGLPVVVPAGTWLENEVRNWGGTYEAFEAWTPASIAAAIERLIPRARDGRETMKAASQRFLAQNSAKAALDQLGDVWLRSAWLRSDMSSDRDTPISVAVAQGRGWYETENIGGKAARWLSPETTITLDIPMRIATMVKIGGPKFASDTIVRGMKVYLNDELISGKADIESDWSGWKFSGIAWTSDIELGKPSVLKIITPPNPERTSDSRHITVMCSEIIFSAQGALAMADKPSLRCPVIFDRGQSAALKVVDGKPSFRLGAISGGTTRLPVVEEGTLRFEVSGQASADMLKGIRIAANGVTLSPVIKLSGTSAGVSAAIPAQALRHVENLVRIEMELPALASTSRLRFSSPGVSVVDPRIEIMSP
jgi:glycosyltransferase involved in cell wall biosynthesis